MQAARMQGAGFRVQVGICAGAATAGGIAQIRRAARTAEQGGFCQLGDMTQGLLWALQQAQAAMQLCGAPSAGGSLRCGCTSAQLLAVRMPGACSGLALHVLPPGAVCRPRTCFCGCRSMLLCSALQSLQDSLQDWAHSLSRHLQLGQPQQERLVAAALQLQAQQGQQAKRLSTAQRGSRAAKAPGAVFAETPARGIHFDSSDSAD